MNPVSLRRSATIALYALCIAGGMWNTLHGSETFIKTLTPFILLAEACAAFVLSYELTTKSIAGAFGVCALTFLCAASGANFGFPFGDIAYTGALGPKVLDVPLVIPFVWLMVLVTSFSAAERILKFKHIVVASIVATAFDAVMEFAADSLDLWHWQGGAPAELNFISWFCISYLGISLLKKYATEKPTDPFVPHILIAQLIYFLVSDIGMRFLPWHA
jgi:uncharacterized membrane protein